MVVRLSASNFDWKRLKVSSHFDLEFEFKEVWFIFRQSTNLNSKSLTPPPPNV